MIGRPIGLRAAAGGFALCRQEAVLPSRWIRKAGALGAIALVSWVGAASAQIDGAADVGALAEGAIGTGPGIAGDGDPAAPSSVDAAIDGLIASIPVGAGPADVAVSPDGARLYVAHTGTDTVSVVDLATRAVVATVAVDDQPVALAISPDGTRLYVAHSRTGLLTSLDTSTDTVAATLDVGLYAMDVAVSPDGIRIYVALGPEGVAVVEAAGNRLLETVPTGGFASRVVVSPDGRRVYVAVQGPRPMGPEMRHPRDRIGVIDALANTLDASVEIGRVPGAISALAVSPDGTRVYAGVDHEYLSVIDTSALAEISRSLVAASPTALAVSPDGTRLYVTSRMRGPVLVISTSGGRTAWINVAARTWAVAVSPDGAQAYVLPLEADVVMVFDTLRVAG